MVSLCSGKVLTLGASLSGECVGEQVLFVSCLGVSEISDFLGAGVIGFTVVLCGICSPIMSCVSMCFRNSASVAAC